CGRFLEKFWKLEIKATIEMKKQLTTLILISFVNTLFGQTNVQRQFIPFLDKESQSNVDVTVCNFNGTPCPPELTNTLSNTNLFTPADVETIMEVFAKYKNITTNS